MRTRESTCLLGLPDLLGHKNYQNTQSHLKSLRATSTEMDTQDRKNEEGPGSRQRASNEERKVVGVGEWLY
jgi:hypothetical protein